MVIVPGEPLLQARSGAYPISVIPIARQIAGTTDGGCVRPFTCSPVAAARRSLWLERKTAEPAGGAQLRRWVMEYDIKESIVRRPEEAARFELLRREAVERAADAQLRTRQARWVLLQQLLLCRPQLSGVVILHLLLQRAGCR